MTASEKASRARAPERLETQRLVLRKPRPGDAEAIFERYASDEEVTRYLAWPRHETIDATHGFLEFSDTQWTQWPCGPYLIESREDDRLLGSSGLAFAEEHVASTGYVLARDAWGCGYATETLRAVVEIARDLAVTRLYALCHVDHAASWRVLEKCGFTREAVFRDDTLFPNLPPGAARDVLRYGLALDDARASVESRALTWIVNLLEGLEVPFQIVGGLAAHAYGATRRLVDLDFYVPSDRLDDVSAAAAAYVIRPPAPHRDDEWDLTFMALEYEGCRIELGGADGARYFDRRDGRWRSVDINYETATRRRILGVEIPLMPLDELVAYKRALDRPVDRMDLEQIRHHHPI